MINSLKTELSELICPHIIGNNLAKKAVGLQLFSEPRLKEFIHLMLIGGAQSGKTDIGHEASKIAFRGSYNGTRITPVGMIERLQYFDGSTCMVQDEMDKVEKFNKRVSDMLLSAMELGQVRVDKYGTHETYPARVNFLACANPRGERLNPFISVLHQTNFPLPFLTRFTLVVPFHSLDPIYYSDVARGVNRRHTSDELQKIKDYIIEQRAKHVNIRVPISLRDKIGERIRWLKEEAVSRDMIGPRTVHSFINCVKARCRMVGIDVATREEFDYVENIYVEAFTPGMI